MVLAQKQICGIIGDTEINPHSYSHLILNIGSKNIYWKKDNIFNSVMGKLNIHMQKSEITSLFLTLCKNPFKVEL
jgi:hypothetical protein